MTDRMIQVPVSLIDCPRCDGRGGLLNTHGEDSDCPRCGGSGFNASDERPEPKETER